MATNNQAVGVVTATKGEVFARGEDGKMRRLNVGDQVFEHDVIVTANGSAADISMFNAPPLSVNEQQTISVDAQVTAVAPDATAASVAPLGSTEAAKVIQTVATGSGLDVNALLEDDAAAAGLTGGDGADGGHTFVDLMRIVENVPGAGYDFPTYGPGTAPILQGQALVSNGLPTAGSLTIAVDEDDLTPRQWDESYLGWQAEFQGAVGYVNFPYARGNSDVVDNSDDLPDPSPTVLTGNLNFSYGPDGMGASGGVVFNLPTEALTSGGEPIQYWVSADGHTVVGYIGESYQPEGPSDTYAAVRGDYFGVTVIFTAQITDSATGAFAFTLYGPLDHAAAGTEDNLIIPLSFTVTDASGDSVTGALNVNVDDDSPVLLGGGVISGTIEHTGGEGDGYGTTVDTWYFTVGQSGPVTIDVKANEYSGDLNGDGVQTYLDSYIYVFTNDNGQPGVLVASNDDSYQTFADGSTNALDSFLNLNLPAGSYILRIGSYHLSEQEARDGFNTSGSTGDYQITFSGNVTASSAGGGGGDTFNLEEESAVPVGNNEPDGLSSSGFGTIVDNVAWGADGFGAVTQVSVGELQVGIPAYGSAMIYFDADGNATLDSEDAAVSVEVYANGGYAIEVLGPLHHATGGGENIFELPQILITGVDRDGDPVDVPVSVTVQDDVPVLTQNSVNVTVDEDDILTPWSVGTSPNDGTGDGSSTGGPGDPFWMPQAAYTSGSLASVVSGGADQPLTFEFTQDAIVQMQALHLYSKQTALPENGLELTYTITNVGGYSILTASEPDTSGPGNTGNPVFELRLNQATGAFEFRLFDELIHVAPESGADENTTLRSGPEGSVDGINFGAIIQAVDEDGDAVSLNGAFTVTVRDDIPIVDIGLARSVVVEHDESAGLQDNDTSHLPSAVASMFNAISNRGDDPDVAGSGAIGFARSADPVVVISHSTEVGADSPALNSEFALQVTDTNSGLKTTEGDSIFLFKEGDVIVGRVGSANGQAAFAIALSDDGELFVAQYLSLQHPNTSSPDETINLSGKVSVSYSITDSDGDTVTDVVSVGGRIEFGDDGPSAGSNATVRLDDDALAGGNPGGFGDDTNGLNTSGTLSHTYGADGGSIAWLTTGAPSGFSYEASGSNLLIKQGGTTVLTLTLDSSTGAYTVTQNAAIDHAAGEFENNQVFNVAYRVTDGDGDKANGTLTINVDDDTPVVFTNAAVQLDDDALTAGNVGGTGDVSPDTANTSGVLSHSYGADGGSIAWLTTGAPAGFSYVASGSDLLIKQGGTTVMTLTLNTSTGAYTVTQNAAIDHPTGSNENDVAFTVKYRVTDGDNDRQDGTLTINVDDDTPTVSGNAAVQLDDDALAGGNAGGIGDVSPDTANTSGTLSHSYGADGGSIAWLTEGAPSGFAYVASGDNLLIKQDGTTVMTLTLNTTTGAYTVTQNAAIDHPSGLNENDLAFTVKYEVTDGDGDKVPGSLTINVDDDTPTIDVSSAVTFTLNVHNYGETSAGYNNSFGYYVKDADGNPVSGVVIWDNVKNFVDGSVNITGYTPDQIGFFIIPNGDNLNAGLTSGTAVTFVMTSTGWQAVAGSTPLLGTGANVLFDVASLNSDHYDHVQNNSLPGNLNWEDIAGGGDHDYNDINIGVTWSSNLPVLTTQDADTIGTDTDSASVSFAGMFNVASSAGADGLGSASTSYTLSITDSNSGLTSAGKAITLAMDGDDIVGRTVDGEVFRISVDDAGMVTLSQSAQVDHLPEDVDAFNDNALIALADGKISLTATASITDGDGDVASDSQSLDISASFRFEDDIPAAVNDQKVVVESAQVGKTYTLMLVVDISDSMNQTEVAQEVTSLKALLDQYALVANGGAAGVQVQIVSFASTASLLTSSLVTIDAAKTVLDGMVARSTSDANGTMTDYDAAVATAGSAINAWTPATATHANVVYFVSDGDPTEGNGTIGLTDAEEANWESILAAKGATAWAVGVGTNTSADDDLADVAMPDGNVVLASNFTTSLLEQLVGTVPPATTITGSVLSNDSSGADGWGSPVLVSVTYGSDTYAFTGANDTHTFNLGSAGSVTIKADGSYVFTPGGDVKEDVSADIKYVVQDGDGDTAGATLTLTVKDSSEVTAVDDVNSVAEGYWTTGSNVTISSTVTTPASWSASSSTTNVSETLYIDPSRSGGAVSDTSGTFSIKADASHPATVQFDLHVQGYQNNSTDSVTVQLLKSGSVVQTFTYSMSSVNHVTFNITSDGTYSLRLVGDDNTYQNGDLKASLDTLTYSAYTYTEASTTSVSVVAPGLTWVDGGMAHGNVIVGSDDTGSEGALLTQVNGIDVAASGYTSITGTYGVLSINAQGEYTYSPNDVDYQAGVQDVFNYTLSQPDGDTANANLTVSITNHDYSASSNNSANFVGGEDSADTLNGLGGNDVVYGDGGNDYLYGGSGNDNVVAASGNDLVQGGSGSDILSGGTGADTFQWVLNDAATANTVDAVRDFSKLDGDVLDLKDLLVGEHSGVAGNPDTFLTFSQVGANTVLMVDTNGNGSGGDAQTIIFENTNLFTQFGAADSHDLVAKMLATNQLKIDG